MGFFCGGGDGSESGGVRIGGGVGCVMRLVWACLNGKTIFLVTFESDVGGSDCIQCWWASPRDGDASGLCELAFVFGSWSFEEDTRCKSGDGSCGRDGCTGGIEGTVGGGGCVSVVVASGVRMTVGGGGAGNSGSAVMSGGGACADIGGAS